MISKDDGTLGEITFTIVQIKIIIVISYAFTRMGKQGKMGAEQEMDILAYYYWNGNENGMYKILRGEWSSLANDLIVIEMDYLD